MFIVLIYNALTVTRLSILPLSILTMVNPSSIQLVSIVAYYTRHIEKYTSIQITEFSIGKLKWWTICNIQCTHAYNTKVNYQVMYVLCLKIEIKISPLMTVITRVCREINISSKVFLSKSCTKTVTCRAYIAKYRYDNIIH